MISPFDDDDPELRRRHAALVGVGACAHHVEPVQRQHAGDLAEGPGLVGIDDRDPVVVARDVDLTGRHQRQRLGIGEELPGHLRHVAAAEHDAGTRGEFVDEFLLPVPPRRRSRRLRVGLGQGVEQFEPFDRVQQPGDEIDRGRIGQVASHRDVGQQQMPFDHRHQRLDVVGGRSRAWAPISRTRSIPTSVWSPG